MVIGIFFFAAVQLFFIGIIGEYIGAIYTQVKNRLKKRGSILTLTIRESVRTEGVQYKKVIRY